jgi:hypothetical protein
MGTYPVSPICIVALFITPITYSRHFCLHLSPEIDYVLCFLRCLVRLSTTFHLKTFCLDLQWRMALVHLSTVLLSFRPNPAVAYIGSGMIGSISSAP